MPVRAKRNPKSLQDLELPETMKLDFIRAVAIFNDVAQFDNSQPRARWLWPSAIDAVLTELITRYDGFGGSKAAQARPELAVFRADFIRASINAQIMPQCQLHVLVNEYAVIVLRFWPANGVISDAKAFDVTGVLNERTYRLLWPQGPMANAYKHR